MPAKLKCCLDPAEEAQAGEGEEILVRRLWQGAEPSLGRADSGAGDFLRKGLGGGGSGEEGEGKEEAAHLVASFGVPADCPPVVAGGQWRRLPE